MRCLSVPGGVVHAFGFAAYGVSSDQDSAGRSTEARRAGPGRANISHQQNPLRPKSGKIRFSGVKFHSMILVARTKVRHNPTLAAANKPRGSMPL